AIPDQGSDELSETAGVMNIMARQIEQTTEELKTRAEENAELAKQHRDGEAKLTAVIEQAAVGITVTDMEGRIQQANQAICDMLGYSESSLAGREFADITHHDDLYANLEKHARLVAGEIENYEIKKRYIASDKCVVWIEATSSLVRDRDGKPAYIVNIIRDVSDRVAAQQKLTETEHMLSDAIEALNDGFVIYDADDRFVMSNEKYREIYSVSADLFEAGTPFETILRAGVERGQYDVDAGYEEDFIRSRLEARRTPAAPFEQIVDDGRIILVSERRMSNGWMVGTRTDLTPLRRVQSERDDSRAEAEKTRSLMETLIENLEDGIVICDEADRVVFANETFSSFDPALTDRIDGGASFADLVAATSDAGHILEIAGEPVHRYAQLRLAHSSERKPLEVRTDADVWWEIRDTLVPGLGRLAIQSNITARKKNEHELEEYRSRLENLVRERTQGLRESEERFRNFADTAADWFWETDAQHRITYISPIVKDLIGVEPGLFIGKSQRELMADEQDLSQFDQHMAELSNQQPFRDFVYKQALGDGEAIWVRASGVPVFDEEGGFLGYRGSGTDISSLKSAEEALFRHEAQFRALVENAPHAIVLRDLNGKILVTNQEYAGLYDQTVDQMLGRNVKDYLNHEAARDVLKRDSGVTENDQDKATYENTYQTSVGQRILSITKFSIRDDEGEKFAVGGIGVDVTQQKAAEAALRQSEAEFRTIIENAPLAIVLRSLDGRFQKVNNAFAEYAGRPVEEIEGRKADEVLTPEFAQIMRGKDREIIANGEPASFEVEVPTTTGSRAAIVNRFFVRDEDGEPIVQVSMATDITERKAMERELSDSKALAEERLDKLELAKDQLVESEKMASLGGLVAGIAHEINTPVGVAVTAASLLRERVDDVVKTYDQELLDEDEFEAFLSEANESSGMILSNLSRADELIRSFKLVAVDQSSDSIRKIDLGAYIGEVIQSLRPQLRKAGVEIKIDAPENLLVELHPGALGQVISNLILNAVTHGLGGQASPEICISANHDKNGLSLHVSDNGRGMDSKTADRIFEPFFTTRRGQGGSGLGMHIVFNLVTQTLGGRIDCKTAPGEGAHFNIFIPKQLKEAKHAVAGAA
ncbi:MAG: PAS domain S-box protein, partial [Pseudomonadota bacterium]